MQLPKKYKVKDYYLSDEVPSLETSKFSLYFSGSCIPINPKFSYYWNYLHWYRQFMIIFEEIVSV